MIFLTIFLISLLLLNILLSHHQKESYKKDYSTYNESNLVNDLNFLNCEEIFGIEKTPVTIV